MAVEKRNFWTTFPDEPLADFAIEFRECITIKDAFDILEQISALTDKYGICKVDFDGGYLGYLDFLKKRIEYQGFISPYHLPGYRYYSNDFKNPLTELCFYEGGKVISKFVSEICNINFESSLISLENTHGRGRFYFENYDPRYGELMPPVSLNMGKLCKEEGTLSFWSITGTLNSDIWLEQVSFLKVHDKEGQVKQIEPSNNQELAYLNTPRLNSFLRGLEHIAKQYHAEWYLEFESGVRSYIVKNLKGTLSAIGFPLDGTVVYLEDIFEGRFTVPKFNTQ